MTFTGARPSALRADRRGGAAHFPLAKLAGTRRRPSRSLLGGDSSDWPPSYHPATAPRSRPGLGPLRLRTRERRCWEVPARGGAGRGAPAQSGVPPLHRIYALGGVPSPQRLRGAGRACVLGSAAARKRLRGAGRACALWGTAAPRRLRGAGRACALGALVLGGAGTTAIWAPRGCHGAGDGRGVGARLRTASGGGAAGLVGRTRAGDGPAGARAGER